MNGYNFTERVRRSLMVAREQAFALHHEYVGTEHILLGICQASGDVAEGVATTALTNLGIDRDAVRQEVLKVVKPGKPDGASQGPDLPYTSRAKRTLELAMTEARNLNHAYVGTEHLLLGLLLEEKGIAAQVLNSLGATVTNVRDEVKRLLGTEASGPPQAAAPRARPVREAQAVITLVVEHGDGRIEAKKFRSAADAARYLAQLEL